MLKKLNELTTELNQIIQNGRELLAQDHYIRDDVWHHFLGELYILESLISWMKRKTIVISFYRITIIIRR